MLLATVLLSTLPAGASEPELELSTRGLPMVGQPVSLEVSAAPGTPFVLGSQSEATFGVTGEDGTWRRAFRPEASGPLRFHAASPSAAGPLATDSLALDVQPASEPRPGDVVVSEIQIDEGWISLFNRRPFEVNLADWTLRDDGGELHVVGDRRLAAHSFLVLAPGARSRQRPRCSLPANSSPLIAVH